VVSCAVPCRYVVDAVWSDWTEWTVCTATCGDAGTQSSSPVLIQLTCRLQQVRRPQSAYHRCTVRTQSRSRTCTAGRHGGLDCVGDDTETRACNAQPCPGTQPYRPTDRPTDRQQYWQPLTSLHHALPSPPHAVHTLLVACQLVAVM